MADDASTNGAPSHVTSVAELEALASELNDAVELYKEKGAVAGADLKYRRKISSTALAILNATKAPEEQWNEQSVTV